MSGADAALATFLHRIGNLKATHRSGWLDRGIGPGEAESVADHSFRTAMLAWLASAAEPAIDQSRVIKLALLHDLAEALTGDQPPYDQTELERLSGVDKVAMLNQRRSVNPERQAAKRVAEQHAFTELTRDLPEATRLELETLWLELAERRTPEAKFVKEADILETWLQAREYETQYPGLPVNSFQQEVDETISFESLRRLRDAAQRPVTET